MAIGHAHGRLLARHHLLDDGPLVTVRRAVPSDEPELTFVDVDVERVGGLVALDDHGAIVGHAGVESGVGEGGWLVAIRASRGASRLRCGLNGGLIGLREPT